MLQSPVATVYSRGRKFALGRATSQNLPYFGGPGSDAVIEGPRYGPRRLHHILTLNHGQFGIQAVRFGFKASFYYGLCFEGCELEWHRTAISAIRISRLDPRKSGKEYPYFGYPDVLPYFPLEIMGEEDATVTDIEAAISNVGWEPAAERVYVVAHSHPDLGVVLIEPGTDGDIVFEYDIQAGRIRAASQVD